MATHFATKKVFKNEGVNQWSNFPAPNPQNKAHRTWPTTHLAGKKLAGDNMAGQNLAGKHLAGKSCREEVLPKKIQPENLPVKENGQKKYGRKELANNFPVLIVWASLRRGLRRKKFTKNDFLAKIMIEKCVIDQKYMKT